MYRSATRDHICRLRYDTQGKLDEDNLQAMLEARPDSAYMHSIWLSNELFARWENRRQMSGNSRRILIK